MYEINGNLTDIDKYKVFSYAVGTVMGEFHKIFGQEIMTKYPLYIDNCNSIENSNCGYTPIITPVLKQILVIKLGVNDFGNIAMIIYQLAHELCHYVFYSIHGITRAKANEEEEIICTAMSLIILKILCEPHVFETYCNHVKALTVSYYRKGYYLAEELEFKIEGIVEKILEK
jgi:hypothetical protein